MDHTRKSKVYVVTLCSRSLFVNAPPQAVKRLITVGSNKKNKAKIIGPKNPCKTAQNFVCRFNSAPKAGQNAPKLYKFVTNVAMRALGTVHATVKAKNKRFPINRLVARRALGILRFFQRMSLGRGARATELPWKCCPFEVLATMWAEGIVE